MLKFKLSTIQLTFILSLGLLSFLDANTMYVATTGSAGSWNTAKNSCVADGGDLVSIHSVAQDVALGNYKADNGIFRPWIGGKAISFGDNFNCETFNFSWSDGTPWDYEPSTFDCNDEGTYSGVYIHQTEHWGVHPTHQALGLCSYSSNCSGCTEISYGEGCTDPEACNYDDTANLDDGSCLENDCSGQCGGSSEVCDELGFCSSNCPDCAEGQVTTDGINCYQISNLAVLQAFIDNSVLDLNPLDIGEQEWNDNGELTSLNIPNGSLSGSIPENIGDLTAVEYLNIYSSNLSGPLPESICDLTNIGFLGLADNDLSGSIPECISNMISLNSLYLNDNQLSGSIPEGIYTLPNLSRLYLRTNQLTGQISEGIGNLTNLWKLYLNGNAFSGPIPESIGNLSNLQHLNLQDNQLIGVIPEGICNLSVPFSSYAFSVSNNYLMPTNEGYPDCVADFVGTQTCPDGEDFDCAGICDDLIVDECGVCDGDTSSCTGCTDDGAYNYDPVNIIDDGSCVYTAAVITSVEDVPNDQGGRVYLSFIKSLHDTDTVEGRSEGYQVERLDGETWVGVASYYAYGIDSYTIEVTTLNNYVNEGDPSTSFRVLASMDEGLFMSDVMEGYSVDNLAPSIPSQLAVDLIHSDGLNAELTWSDPVDDDFSYFNIYRNEEVIGQTTMSTYSDPNPLIDADNVYSISAIDVNTNESDISAAVELFIMLGDLNLDVSIDVADIVLLINFIIYDDHAPDDTEFILSDLNSDGLLNVVDIVMLVDIIIGGDLARENLTHEASFLYGNGMVNYKSDGKLAGIQLEVIGDFEITDNHLPDGWEIANSENTIILYSLDGSSLTEKTLFEYKGDLTIESAIVADWHGSKIQVNSLLLPGDFALTPAYPNPFNPVTNINFSLPIDSEVSISVYNLQGREVSMLIGANMNAGYHSIVWNADSYNSGVYFVKMVAGEYVFTQKIMLVK